MQISKITQPMFTKAPIMFKSETAPQAEPVENKELPTAENYGRAMVNFKGAGVVPRRILCLQDKMLMETLTDTLALTKEKALELRKEFKIFLTENNYRSLNDVEFQNGDDGFIEECEFVGKITDRLSKKIGLNESQEDALNMELVKRMDEKDNYVPGGKAYLQEMNMLDGFLKKNANKIFR